MNESEFVSFFSRHLLAERGWVVERSVNSLTTEALDASVLVFGPKGVIERNAVPYDTDRFVELKRLLISSFVIMDPAQRLSMSKSMDNVIYAGCNDSDLWVQFMCQMLRGFPGTGVIKYNEMLTYFSEDVSDDEVPECFAVMKGFIKQFLPGETSFPMSVPVLPRGSNLFTDFPDMLNELPQSQRPFNLKPGFELPCARFLSLSNSQTSAGNKRSASAHISSLQKLPHDSPNNDDAWTPKQIRERDLEESRKKADRLQRARKRLREMSSSEPKKSILDKKSNLDFGKARSPERTPQMATSLLEFSDDPKIKRWKEEQILAEEKKKKEAVAREKAALLLEKKQKREEKLAAQREAKRLEAQTRDGSHTQNRSELVSELRKNAIEQKISAPSLGVGVESREKLTPPIQELTAVQRSVLELARDTSEEDKAIVLDFLKGIRRRPSWSTEEKDGNIVPIVLSENDLPAGEDGKIRRERMIFEMDLKTGNWNTKKKKLVLTSKKKKKKKTMTLDE